MLGASVYRFGRFTLDLNARQLCYDGTPVPFSSAQFAILALLVAKAPAMLPREELIESAWGRAPINENSLNKTIERVRRILIKGGLDARCIETQRQGGYRFTAPVQRVDHTTGALSNHRMAPFRAFMLGRQALRTLNSDAIACALQDMEATRQEQDADALASLALACGLAFEATTIDKVPDFATLDRGIEHARTAAAQNRQSAYAWSVLAFVLHLKGIQEEAAFAVHMARAIGSLSWQPLTCIAYVTWGEERILHGQHALDLCPNIALLHWLLTTVYIARGAAQAALEQLRFGCAAQDAQVMPAAFPGVGLHLLHAMVLASQNRLDEAEAAAKRELKWADSKQIYARECEANTWYLLGAIALRRGNRGAAESAFTRTLTVAPAHVAAGAILRGTVPAENAAQRTYHGRFMDRALAQAIVLWRGNRHADAARVYREFLVKAPPGSAGWSLPVEPLLNPLARPDDWGDVLAILRSRAL